jgi:uncharacterized protein
VIDNHAHPFALEGGRLRIDELTLDVETDCGGDDRRQLHGPSRVFQELLTVRLARRLGCRPDDLPEAREEASRDWPSYVSGLFQDAGLRALVIDPGSEPVSVEMADEFTRLAGCSVYWIVRIDPVIDRMIGLDAGVSSIVDEVGETMNRAASAGCVGFKSILAYRTGLAVDPDVTLTQAESSLRSEGHLPVRRRGKHCRDLVLRLALGVSADLQLPFQIHTGMGDSELRLGEANPLLLDELLRTREGAAARIVLMHGSYPWIEELAYLAATRPTVFADFSLATIFSPLETANRLAKLVDLAPSQKVLLGTDGHSEPETHWFASTILAEAWEEVCDRLAIAGARTSWLRDARDDIFEKNARSLYGLT